MLGTYLPFEYIQLIDRGDRVRRSRTRAAGGSRARGNGRVVATEARREVPPVGYDPSQFPAFAVTVDVVILTMSAGKLHMLLVAVEGAVRGHVGDPRWVQASHRDAGRGGETRARRGNGCRRAEPAPPSSGRTAIPSATLA